MFRNYLKVSFRNLWNHKLFSITNILGLSTGIICCLLILIYVNHELKYDQWNPNAEDIVRITMEGSIGGNILSSAESSGVIAPDAASLLPDIENWCRFRDYGGHLVKVDGSSHENITVHEALTVDSSFYSLFPVEMIAGDPRHALTQPQTVNISRSLATQLFQQPETALNQMLLLNNEDRFQVTGVFEDLPSTTHFDADLLLAMNGNEEIANEIPLWGASNNFFTYLLLRDGTDHTAFYEKFISLSKERVGQLTSQFVGLTLEEFEATGQYMRLGLQPLVDIHLKSHKSDELQANGNIQYVWIFSSIAFFVLLIACINFMNLTTARSTKRAEEIAVRKVLGSSRSQLINQFLGESFMVTLFAVILALGISIFIMPWFSELTGRDLSFPYASTSFWTLILAGTLIVSLLAGSYPALFLSGFKPVESLKQNFTVKKGHHFLRSGLVVVQFSIATVLIIGTLLIYQQIKFIQQKNLGYSKDQIIVLNSAQALGQNLEAYKEKILQNAYVSSATVSGFLPIPSYRSNSTYGKTAEFRQDNLINMQRWRVDHDYLKTLDLALLEGRFFDRNFPSDSTAIVINESAAKVLQYDEPIGEKVYGIRDGVDVPQSPEDFQGYTIVGVVEDFHFQGLREPISSLAMFLGRSTGHIAFKYEAGASSQLLDQMEVAWREMAVGQPFSYQFMDESFARTYDAEKRVGTIALVFALLAIIVSCLGLFGLSTYVVEQRTKEIGIRKVLGATTTNLVTMLSTGFLKLVGIAFIIAIPFTWYAMAKWLENFAYRIDIHWWTFFVAGIIAIILAFVTVSIQSLRAAISNPVESIRSE